MEPGTTGSWPVAFPFRPTPLVTELACKRCIDAIYGKLNLTVCLVDAHMATRPIPAICAGSTVANPGLVPLSTLVRHASVCVECRAPAGGWLKRRPLGQASPFLRIFVTHEEGDLLRPVPYLYRTSSCRTLFVMRPVVLPFPPCG